MFNFDNNDFADLNSGYSIPENNNFGLNSHPLELTHGGPSADAAWAGGLNLDGTVTGPSIAEIENWWLAPRPEGDANEYLGSTLLESFGGEYAGICGSQAEPTSVAGSFNTDGTYGLSALGQQPVYTPDYAGSSTVDPSTIPVPFPSTQLPSHFSATLAGPRLTPSPVPSLSWAPPPPSTSYPDNCRPGLYDQPLAMPDTRGKWPYQIPVGKGKTRAAAQPCPTRPPSAGNTTWRHQQTYTPQGYGAGQNLQMSPLTDLPALIAPSTGPQRSIRGAGGKGKEIVKSEGKRKRIPKAAPPPGVDWPDTTRRFCAEMLEIYLNQPAGEVLTPETAYARITKFVKEDLNLSPLVAKTSEQRLHRDLEQYLTAVLNELCPRVSGQKRGVRYMLERVADRLENELVIVNDDFALQDGPSNEVDPEKLDVSEAAVKRRLAEQARRGAIRGSLERITLFFKVPRPKFQWSRPQALFLATTYVVLGAGAFSDCVELFTPKPQL